VTVRATPGNRTLAHGLMSAASVGAARLDATVPAGVLVTVCIASQGRGRAALLGSDPSPDSGSLTTGGRPTGKALALIFLRPRSSSLLSLMPTVFHRAALFRFEWVGTWTFWLLAAGLLIAFALGATAVVHAAREDA
jgi:hypothetical protein